MPASSFVTSHAPMVSVVIPNLHSPLIADVIATLEAQTQRARVAEIIVVGQDRHGLVPPSARFIRTPTPIPAAAARNLGARAACADTLLFIDADCLAAPDLVEHMLAHRDAGQPIIGGSLTIEPDPYWIACDNLLAFAPFLDSAPAGTRPFLLSGNLCVTRELFFGVGGFDERFRGAAGEDVDLGLRLQAAGAPLVFEPRARVTHRPGRASAGAVWGHLRTYGRIQVTNWQRHPERMPPPAPLPWLRRLAGALLAVAPLLAVAHVARWWRTVRPRPPLHLFPGLVWARTAWYWGVAEALMVA